MFIIHFIVGINVFIVLIHNILYKLLLSLSLFTNYKNTLIFDTSHMHLYIYLLRKQI